MLDESSQNHRKLDASEGLQDAQLDDGSRIHIVHGDLSHGGNAMVNIRKFTGVPFRSLRELVERGMLDAFAARFLRAAVRANASIVFAGVVVEAAVPEAGTITEVVLVTVAMSAILHGVTAAWGARRYAAWFEDAAARDPGIPEAAQREAPIDHRRSRPA